MAGGTMTDDVERLFRAGALGAAPDGRLLDWFAAGEGATAESAFAELVNRHGPMVLRVCRESLRDAHDADDAYQAVFLVLATRAGSIRRRDSLPGWLYGVARRASAKARRSAARRSARDRAAAPRAIGEGRDDGPDLEALHEEIEALPERLRAPLILCHLQGLTYETAADRLGVSESAIRGRLTRARDRLRLRLTRRGVSAGVAMTLAGGASVARAAAPAPTLSVSQVARGLAAGDAPSTLARGVSRAMTLHRIGKATAAAALLLAAGLGAWRAAASADEPPPKPDRPDFRMVGAVRVEETGEPVPGATVWAMTTGTIRRSIGDSSRATTGPDGRYSIELKPGFNRFGGVAPPVGYLTTDAPSHDEDIIVTDDRPAHEKDFVVRRGVVWDFRVLRTDDMGPVEGARVYAPGSSEDTNREGEARLTLPPEGNADLRIDVVDQAPNDEWLTVVGRLRFEPGFRPDAIRSVEGAKVSPAAFRLIDDAGKTASIVAPMTEGSRLEPRIEDGRLVVQVVLTEPALKADGAMVGTVVDESGAPIAGADVRLIWFEGPGPYEKGVALPRCRATTDARGEFRIGSIPLTRRDGTAASVSLSIAKEGFESVDRAVRFEAPEGAPQSVPAVALRPEAVFRGRVLDDDDRPVEGAWIWTGGPRAVLTRPNRTDRDGRFAIHGHPVGRIGVDIVYGRRRGGDLYQNLPDAPPTTIHLYPRPKPEP